MALSTPLPVYVSNATRTRLMDAASTIGGFWHWLELGFGFWCQLEDGSAGSASVMSNPHCYVDHFRSSPLIQYNRVP